MDITTLVLAKNYTDEQIKQNSSGGIDLSGYYTREEIDAMDFVTSDELPEGSMVDKTLTIEGQAADAKVTGDRLGAIEYQTVTTDLAYKHKDLPEGEKAVTIKGDGIFGNTAYVGNFTNLIPNGGFDRTFPYRGITVSKKGNGYVISGTVVDYNATVNFTDDSGNYLIPMSSDLIGKTLLHAVFSNVDRGSPALSVTFLAEDKTTQTGKVSDSLKNHTKEIVVPEGTAYYKVAMFCPLDNTYDNEFKYYLIEKDKCQTVALSEGSAEIQGVTDTTLSSIPYKSTMSYVVTLRELIDNHAGGGTVSYLTPEDFGASGDGSADDSEAIAECLNIASQTGQMVIMAKKYYISSPIIITQSGLEIICNDIVYNGIDCAVKIIGRENKIKIHSIVSGGVGLAFEASGQKSTSYNSIEINTISSLSHGIVFYKGSKYAHQNTIKFDLIKAGGSGCYGIAVFKDENYPNCFIAEMNFYGGQISNCEWAVYKVGGLSRCYGFEIEENVDGGFWTDSSGGLIIYYPRLAESQRDGSLPYFKFESTQNVFIYPASPIAINEIDLSEAIDVFENASNVENPLHEQRISIIDGIIQSRLVTSANGDTTYVQPNVYTTKAYLWGKFLIMTPHMEYRKVVNTENIDLRILGTTEEPTGWYQGMAQLPTKFVVDNINSEIYLHESYCAFGFNEFEVEQANDFICKIYDKLNNLIFDGTEQGNGTYKFKVYKDCDRATQHGSGLLRRDFLGHYWQITKETTVNDVLNALPTWSGGAY